MKQNPKLNPTDQTQRIFVFGSNLAGRHGKGAALRAKDYYGAIYGNGQGLQGRSYAIPTKDHELRSLSLEQVRHYVDLFKVFAGAYPSLEFNVTRIGCGLAGFKDNRIAPLFHNSPGNCWFDPEWRIYLNYSGTKFWRGPL